jgi:SPP1 family predicted phage head-tail adaptor
MFNSKKYHPRERSGQLNQQVQVHFPVQTVNSYGERVEAWQALGYRWAKIEYFQKDESDEAGQVTAMTSVNFTMRNNGDINETMRLYYNSRLYNVQAIHISDDRLFIKCLSEQYNTGTFVTPSGEGAIGELAYIQEFTGITGDRVTVTVFGGQVPQNKAQVFVTRNGLVVDAFIIAGSQIIFQGITLIATDKITVRFFT